MSTGASEAIGTVIGTIAAGEVLAGWEIIAAGNGAAIAMKSGSCFARFSGECTADEAWAAVTARLWARTTDAELEQRIAEVADEVAAATKAQKRTGGARAALDALIEERDRRQGAIA